jgi:hypothetical protein
MPQLTSAGALRDPTCHIRSTPGTHS